MLLPSVAVAQVQPNYWKWYTLPAATETTLGGVKAPTCSTGYYFAGIDGSGQLLCVLGVGGGGGSGLPVDPTACSAGQYVSDQDINGTLTCGTPAGTYSLPAASTTLGGVKMASACGAGNHVASIGTGGELGCTADSGGGYTLPALTATVLGGVKGTGTAIACTLPDVAMGFDAAGALQCGQPSSVTGSAASATGNAGTATALSTAGAANQFWKNGNVWGQPAFTDISGTATDAQISGPYLPRGGAAASANAVNGAVVSLATNITGRLPLANLTDDDTTANLCLVSGGAGGEPSYATCPGGGGGAPTTAKYLLQTADGALANAQAMGALGSGLVVNATTTGVQSIYAGVTCTLPNVMTALSASGSATCAQPTNVSGNSAGATTAASANAVNGAVISLTANATVNQGTTTTLLHGNAAGSPSWAGVSLTADATANQGTVSTFLRGNAAGQPTWSAVDFTDLSGAATAAQIPTASTTLGGVKMAAACSAGNHVASIVAGELTCTADSGGGGAPTTATYWTSTADTGLSAEVNLGGLTTGLLLNTVTGGTAAPSAYAGTSCTNQFPRSLSASGAATCAGVGVSDFTANQGTTTQVLHGNAAGQPSWGAIAVDDLPTVTIAKGGTGVATIADDQLIVGTGADTTAVKTLTNCTGASDALSYNTTTNAFGCTTISGGSPTFSGLTAGGIMYASSTTAIASSGNALISAAGHINLLAATTPATPGAGIGTLYGKQRAGRVVPTMISPDGTQQTTQEALFSNSVQIMLPNTGTTVPLAFTNTWTGRASTGTLSHPAIATTNHLTLMRSSLYTSGAVAGQGYGIQGTFAMNYLGNAANRGGFFFFARFGFTAYSSAARVFVGLTTQNAAYGATEPSTVNNTVGLCKDSTDGTVAFCMRGTAVTKNGTWTPAANTVYDFTMSAPPNSTTITYRLVDETNGTVVFDNLSTSTNAPAVNTLMYPWTWVGASSAVSQIMAVGKVYIASDY
jgi:hypothetical protein